MDKQRIIIQKAKFGWTVFVYTGSEMVEQAVFTELEKLLDYVHQELAQ